MNDTPRFDLLLLGYRNDLARERTRYFLRHLPEALGGSVDVGPQAALPCLLFSDIDHARGLRLAGQLRERGAYARLVAREAAETPPVPRRAVWASKTLFAALVLLVCGAAYLRLPLRPSPLPPPGFQDVERGPDPRPFAPAEISEAQQRLNTEAVALNEAGDFAEAAERLRQALKHQPEEPVLRRNLRTVLHNWAVAELNANRPASAIGLAEEGLSLGEDPALLAALGVAQARTADWTGAQRSLERSVHLGVSDPGTLVALGKVYRQQGNRQRAVEMFQRAREKGASGTAFDESLQRLERELDAEWGFDELRSPHFEISFSSGENREAARVVLGSLEEAYFVVGRKLDSYLPDRTQVVLYPEQEFHDVTQAPSWTGGVYDGRIKLPVRGLHEAGPLLDRTLRHEYAHVVVNHLTHGNVPVWLNEGVAIWAEGDRGDQRLTWARDTIAGRRLFRLGDLRRPFIELPAEQVNVAYAQSYLAVHAIVGEYGERRLRDLLVRLGTGQSFAAAFQQALSTRLADFENGLIRDLIG
jgi:tetratricopeptide (TPR) repeat protein